MQVVPIKHTLKAPCTKRLKPQHEKLLSKIDFNFKLRRYIKGELQVAANEYALLGRGSYSSTSQLNLSTF